VPLTDSSTFDEIEKWASVQSKDWARLIALRAALRVLPLALSIKNEHESFLLHLLRCCFVGWVGGVHGVDPKKFRAVAGPAYRSLSDQAKQLRKIGRERKVAIGQADHAGGAIYYALRSIAGFVPTEGDLEKTLAHVSDATRSLSELEDVRMSIVADAMTLTGADGERRLRDAALWQQVVSDESGAVSAEPPDWITKTILAFQEERANRSWTIWLRWYNALLQRSIKDRSGFDQKIDFEIALQPPKFWTRPTEVVLENLAAIARQEQFNFTSDDANEPESGSEPEPDVPEQRPGPSFSVSAAGQLSLANSGAVGATDAEEIDAIRDVLLEAISDLEAACEGSNAFNFVARTASAYRRALSGETAQVSIDRLYANGVRLENANTRVKLEIAAGTLPEQGIHVGEAMDSVIALHGSVVMGTERGRLHIARSRDFHKTGSEVAAYKAQAIRFAESVRTSKNLLDEEAKELIVVVNNEIAEGRHPERSTVLAQTTNANLLSAIGKYAVVPLATSVAGYAFTHSATGTAIAAELSPLMDAIVAFVMANTVEIRAFVAVAGAELIWFNSFLAWLELQVASRK
jgi:hypothetical protein